MTETQLFLTLKVIFFNNLPFFSDDVDGNNMVDLEDKNRSETPPPSYDEALAINIQPPENPLHPPDGATSNNIP